MEPLVQAIQNKYNISGDEATKVLQTLVQVEQKRQTEAGTGNMPAGVRAMGAGRGVGSDIMGLLGGVMNNSGSGQQNKQGGITGELMGLLGGNNQQNNQGSISGDLMGLFGGMLGGNNQQAGQSGTNMGSLVSNLLNGNHNMGSSGNLLGIVLDLLSNGGQQNHANSLENIVGGLLGGSAGQGNMDASSLVGRLLGGV